MIVNLVRAVRGLSRPGALLAALLAGGCATTPPSTFYVLTPLPEAAARTAPLTGGRLAVGVGPVTFPDYLDRPQLVSRAGSNRLALDELQRWGGSLQDDFPRVLSENLAYLLGTSRVLIYPSDVRLPMDLRVVAEVLAFEADASGDAVLRVRWSVLDPYTEAVLAVRETGYRSQAKGEGQEAVVAALSETLGAFSRDVAEVLRALPKPRPPAPELPPI
jgi:uncharacterized lipoprotein YmbA